MAGLVDKDMEAKEVKADLEEVEETTFKKKHEYKDKEFKVWKYGNGQDKYLATFSKVHDMNIIKIQASYENGIDIAKSIRASEIVYIDGMALEDNISEDTYVKK